MKDSQKGITLVEVLASLSLLSIILLLASSIHIFGYKQMSSQTQQIQNQSDERLAIKLITKEIRKADPDKVEVKEINVLTINGINYKLNISNIIKGNNVIGYETFIPNISKFFVTKNGNEIKLTVGNLPETIIYLRK